MTDDTQKPDIPNTITPLALEEAMAMLQRQERDSFSVPEIPARERSWLEQSERYERLNIAVEETDMKADLIQSKLGLAKERPKDRTLPHSPKTIAKLEAEKAALYKQAQGFAEEAEALRPAIEELGRLPSSTGESTIAENATQYSKQFASAHIAETEALAEAAARRDGQMRKNPRQVEYPPYDPDHPDIDEARTMPYGGKRHHTAAVKWTEKSLNSANEEMKIAYLRGAEVGVTGDDIQRARMVSDNLISHEIYHEVTRASQGRPMRGELANAHEQVYKMPKLLDEQPPKYQLTEKDIAAKREENYAKMAKRVEEERAKSPSLSLGFSLRQTMSHSPEPDEKGNNPSGKPPKGNRGR